MPLTFKIKAAGHSFYKGILCAVLSICGVSHKGIANTVDCLKVSQIERFKIPLHGFASLSIIRYDLRVQIVGWKVKICIANQTQAVVSMIQSSLRSAPLLRAP